MRTLKIWFDMRNGRLYYCAIQLTSIQIDWKSRFLLALHSSGKGLVRQLTEVSRIVCCLAALGSNYAVNLSGVNLGCFNAYAEVEWANDMKLHVFATKHKTNTYHKYLN